MYRYLIVADDFTGSNDTGVQLKRRGINTNVVFSSETINTDLSSFVIDTESRAMPEDEAYKKIENILRDVDFLKFEYVLKKVDSTLRGNIAKEIKAVDDVYKSDLIIFAPAFPNLKRTTVNGIHMLNNVRITHTEMARDPKTPVKEDNINLLIKHEFNEEIHHIYLRDVRKGKIDFSRGRIYTLDAETNEDLITIVQKGIGSNKKVLWVGSAGLADGILKVNTNVNPAIAVVGSISEVSKNQLHYAVANNNALVKINIGRLLESNDISSIVREVLEKINQGLDVIIASSYERQDYDKDIQLGQTLSYSKEEVSVFTQRILGKIIAEVLEASKISGLFLTGGDTAIGVIEELDANGSSIEQEIMTGIPLMTLRGGRCDGLKVITKAGAFGEINAIDYCLRKLKGDI